VALVHRPLDEGVRRLEVEDVEFVDPRRNDQQRPLRHFLGGRRVLQKLDQVVLVDDLARRHRDVLADLEGLEIGHADLELPLAALQVLEQVFQALHQVLAAAVDGGAQHFRIGQHEVARRHRVDELAGIEVDLARGLVVQTVDVLHGRLHPARGQQVRLLDEVEHLVVLPGDVLEAAVVLGRCDDGVGLLAHHALGGRLPQVHVVLPERELRSISLAGSLIRRAVISMKARPIAIGSMPPEALWNWLR
jgi:hypothetical protein